MNAPPWVAPLLLAVLLPTMAYSADRCAESFTRVAPADPAAPIPLADDPAEFLRVLNGTPGAGKVSNARLLEVLNREVLEEITDARDFENRRGRFQKAMARVFEKIPRSEYERRLREGDLVPIARYVEEVPDPSTHVSKAEKQLYYRLNSALAKNTLEELKGSDPALSGTIGELDRALSALPPVDGVVYRGTSLPDALVAEILTGKPQFENRIYMSSSLDVWDALQFAAKRESAANRTPTLMIIRTRSGRITSHGTDFAREEEVLIPRETTRFRIQRAFKGRPERIGEEAPDYLLLFLSETP